MGLSVDPFRDIDLLFWCMSTYGIAAERSCIHSFNRDCHFARYLVKALAIKNSMVKPYGRGV